MAKRLTKDKINEILSPRKISIVGDFKTVDHRSKFRCHEGHEWETRVSNTLYGANKSSCPICYETDHFLTKEKINERLAHRGIKLIDEVYINTKTARTFKCLLNHEWVTLPRTVLSGYNCPQCSSNAILNVETINERLKKYSIVLVGNYVNSETHSKFRCDKGHEWSTKAGHVIGGYSGCPHCSQFGFRSSLPGSLYVLHFKSLGCIKFGISNYFEKRHRQLSKQSKCVLLHKIDFENGQDARLLENKIKIRFGTRFVNKDQMPDGYTETLPESMKDELLEILKVV